MGSPLSSLKIDYWYKAVLVISTALLVIALTVPMQGVPNSAIALLSLSGVFIGLGEWINHPLQERIGGGFKISGHPRNNSPLGVLLVAAGLALAGYGIYKLAQ